MKTNALTRLYALVMGALFATVATIGVAAVMASSGEQSRMEFNARAVAHQSAHPATMDLSQVHVQASGTRQVL